MSKVVTIPKDRNPFVVIVNGVKHSYPAGVSTEVPDEVADVIEKYVGAKPKPDPNAGINFGGTQSDWNQTDSSAADFIKNKPFGDMPTGGDTLYWDGNTEGLEVYNGYLFKVSDEHITREQLVSGYSIGIYEDGGFQNITYEDDRCVLTVEEELWLFIGEEEASNDGVPTVICNSSGVWFADIRAMGAPMYVFSLTIPGYTGFPVTKKIEEKYLPGAVILYGCMDDNGSPLLYNDSAVSERTTKTQLFNSFENGRVLLDTSAIGVVGKFTIIGVSEEESCALGFICVEGFGAMGFYTAEYTAS